ncbi:MAG TPA: hypothetical protein EYP73_06740, partial [Acidimicrobiia bacterium]|nr:hypothetical protein [Acidimicrobiia bacterium]
MSSYRTITPAQIGEGTEAAIGAAETILAELVAPNDRRTFENTLLPLDQISDVLSKAFAAYAFMGYVHLDK